MEVYYMNVTEIPDYAVEDSAFQAYEGFLDLYLRQKLVRIRHLADKKRSLGAYLLLLHAWQEQAQAGRRMPEIERTAEGKPYFAAEGAPEFNLSHSGSFAVCAFQSVDLACESVGVDIQEVREVSARFTERFFSQGERIKAAQGGADMAAEIWSRKESLAKYRGCGLRGKLSEFNTEGCQEFLRTFEIFEAKEGDNYFLTVCTAKPCRIQLHEIHFSQLDFLSK